MNNTMFNAVESLDERVHNKVAMGLLCEYVESRSLNEGDSVYVIAPDGKVITLSHALEVMKQFTDTI